MGQAQGKSDFHPREPTLERNQTRGAQSPRSRKTAQEGGLPREYRGCPGRQPGTRKEEDQGDQVGRVNYRRHGAHSGCSRVKATATIRQEVPWHAVSGASDPRLQKIFRGCTRKVQKSKMGGDRLKTAQATVVSFLMQPCIKYGNYFWQERKRRRVGRPLEKNSSDRGMVSWSNRWAGKWFCPGTYPPNPSVGARWRLGKEKGSPISR